MVDRWVKMVVEVDAGGFVDVDGGMGGGMGAQVTSLEARSVAE